MPKYIGLTIGPLYKTMTRVKATRELWASSYIFSYIMKKMIEKVIAYAGTDVFIIPYVKDEEIFKPGQQVGLFHDRFIFKAGNDDFEKVEQIKKNVMEEIAENMSQIISENDSSKIYDFLNHYFQIYFCEMEIDGEYNKVNEELNKVLDGFELQTKFIKEEEGEKSYLSELFYRVNKSFLAKDAFGSIHSFPSIPEIAAIRGGGDLDWNGIELRFQKDQNNENTQDTDDTDIYKQLEEQNRETIKQYHKYIAIVQADGDHLGETIKALKSDKDFGKLSKALLKFSQDAHNSIKNYGGTTIYAGGDDLLFFAPVVSGKQNIFRFVEELAEMFGLQFQEFDPAPTLSAGISITYYKYPMGEALESAANLLFHEAKETGGRNAIAYEVQKHSGQRITGVFHRKDEDYEAFKDLIYNKEDNKMLTSLIHKLSFHGALIEEIGKDVKKVRNYFDNFFNEEEHNTHVGIKENAAKLINAAYTNTKRSQKKEIVFSVLRLKKFLEGGE
ncbi:type III-B CRISPR-associated protein Cas10/Cmr2 [candidate division KSB1 bacterium]|nr:type III-B CRISPR-associated protein Cas10/Cmr2 [candidate division KSB1 bacterium]